MCFVRRKTVYCEKGGLCIVRRTVYCKRGCLCVVREEDCVL